MITYRPTHQEVLGVWNVGIRRAGRAPDLAEAIKSTILETVEICHAVSGEHPVDAQKRMEFLFTSKEHGLAGWTKEAL